MVYWIWITITFCSSKLVKQEKMDIDSGWKQPQAAAAFCHTTQSLHMSREKQKGATTWTDLGTHGDEVKTETVIGLPWMATNIMTPGVCLSWASLYAYFQDSTTATC